MRHEMQGTRGRGLAVFHCRQPDSPLMTNRQSEGWAKSTQLIPDGPNIISAVSVFTVYRDQKKVEWAHCVLMKTERRISGCRLAPFFLS